MALEGCWHFERRPEDRSPVEHRAGEIAIHALESRVFGRCQANCQGEPVRQAVVLVRLTRAV